MITNDMLLAISLTGIGVCTLIRCIINASDCLPDLLADHPDLRDAIEHDTAWISFPTHTDRRKGDRHGK